METVPQKIEWSHYERRPIEGKFYPNDRDDAVLLELFYNRFRHAGQLQALFGFWITERLTLLFKAGLVHRPNVQWIWRRQKGGGSKPLVYALSQQGYKHLRAQRLVPCTRVDFDERNRELSEYSAHLPHELSIGDVQVAFAKGCTKLKRELMHIQKLARGENAQALSIPGRDKKLYPDWPFAVPKPTSEPNLFFAEINMYRSEPNSRHEGSNLQHLEYKYESYLAYALSKQCLEQFGVSNFRVLTITKGGNEKVKNVALTAGKICKGNGVGRFLVTNFAALESGDPFEARWLDASGEEVRLGV